MKKKKKKKTNSIFPPERFSSFEKLLLVTAYVQRIFLLMKNKSNSYELSLTVNELRNAELCWIKYVQEITFGNKLRRPIQHLRVHPLEI